MYAKEIIGYAYDLHRVIALLQSHAPLREMESYGQGYLEFLIDGFIKHTIEGFQIVSVTGHNIHDYTPEQLSWFMAQTEAISLLWETMAIPVFASGKPVYIARVKDVVWLFAAKD
jgi:hypothetical protein